MENNSQLREVTGLIPEVTQQIVDVEMEQITEVEVHLEATPIEV